MEHDKEVNIRRKRSLKRSSTPSHSLMESTKLEEYHSPKPILGLNISPEVGALIGVSTARFNLIVIPTI